MSDAQKNEGPTPFPGSICHQCQHLRRVTTQRSVFLLCRAPGLPRYVPQPVRACPERVPPAEPEPR